MFTLKSEHSGIPVELYLYMVELILRVLVTLLFFVYSNSRCTAKRPTGSHHCQRRRWYKFTREQKTCKKTCRCMGHAPWEGLPQTGIWKLWVRQCSHSQTRWHSTAMANGYQLTYHTFMNCCVKKRKGKSICVGFSVLVLACPDSLIFN